MASLKGNNGDGGGAAPSFAMMPSQWKVETSTHIGGRPRQEDRYYVRSNITLPGNNGEAAFFGVWDGTVDPHASDYVHTRCCDHHLRTDGFRAYTRLLEQGETRAQELARCIGQACKEGYAATDEAVELTPKDTASLLSLVSDATSQGFAGHRKRAAMAKLAELVRELRLSS